jgi:ubiquitin-like-conjugating enzyme ATG3
LEVVDDNFLDELDDSSSKPPEKEDSESEDDLEDGLDDSLEEIEENKKEKPKKEVQNLPSNRRTYKISITYDFYYNTPRLWIQGLDSKNKPLTEAEIYEDIMSDYKGKTVTMEKHPHLGRESWLCEIKWFAIKKGE